MYSSSIKEKAFFGAAISLEGVCMVQPLKIKEIIGIGQERYNSYLNMLTMTESDI